MQWCRPASRRSGVRLSRSGELGTVLFSCMDVSSLINCFPDPLRIQKRTHISDQHFPNHSKIETVRSAYSLWVVLRVYSGLETYLHFMFDHGRSTFRFRSQKSTNFHAITDGSRQRPLYDHGRVQSRLHFVFRFLGKLNHTAACSKRSHACVI